LLLSGCALDIELVPVTSPGLAIVLDDAADRILPPGLGVDVLCWDAMQECAILSLCAVRLVPPYELNSISSAREFPVYRWFCAQVARNGSCEGWASNNRGSNNLFSISTRL